MSITFTHEVDTANKILICEIKGVSATALDAEHMFKMLVKLAGKGQVKNVVVDVTQMRITYSTVQMTCLMNTMQEESWLADLKIAWVIDPKDHAQNLLGEMSEKYNLPIKKFDNRSEALMWLLFNI